MYNLPLCFSIHMPNVLWSWVAVYLIVSFWWLLVSHFWAGGYSSVAEWMPHRITCWYSHWFRQATRQIPVCDTLCRMWQHLIFAFLFFIRKSLLFCIFFFSQALSMGMMTEYYHFIFTTLVSGESASAPSRASIKCCSKNLSHFTLNRLFVRSFRFFWM